MKLKFIYISLRFLNKLIKILSILVGKIRNLSDKIRDYLKNSFLGGGENV